MSVGASSRCASQSLSTAGKSPLARWAWMGREIVMAKREDTRFRRESCSTFLGRGAAGGPAEVPHLTARRGPRRVTTRVEKRVQKKPHPAEAKRPRGPERGRDDGRGARAGRDPRQAV